MQRWMYYYVIWNFNATAARFKHHAKILYTGYVVKDINEIS